MGKAAVASSAAALGLGAAALDPAEFKMWIVTCHAREERCFVHLTPALLSLFCCPMFAYNWPPKFKGVDHNYASLVAIRGGLGEAS